MPATPRDLLKPRAQRLAEVANSVQLQAGQANAQQIIFGLTLEAETKKFKVLEGEYFPDGVSQPVLIKTISGISIPAGATTGAGQKCFVLVEVNAKEEAFTSVSALTTGTPVLPALTAGRIAVGYIEIPESFTAGTTNCPTGTALKAIKYSAGNTSPTGGF